MRRLLAVTAPLRREPRRAWAAARLGLYAVVVAGVFLWVRTFDPRPWAALLLAAGPAVLLSPMLLLSLATVTGRRDTVGRTPQPDTPNLGSFPAAPRPE